MGTNAEAMRSHLRGANHLMDYVLRTQPSSIQSNLGSYIMEIYVYHASLASLTVGGSDLAILQSNLGAESLNPQHGKVGNIINVHRCHQELWGPTCVPIHPRVRRSSLFCKNCVPLGSARANIHSLAVSTCFQHGTRAKS
jgi:hypothetical protein